VSSFCIEKNRMNEHILAGAAVLAYGAVHSFRLVEATCRCWPASLFPEPDLSFSDVARVQRHPCWRRRYRRDSSGNPFHSFWGRAALVRCVGSCSPACLWRWPPTHRTGSVTAGRCCALTATCAPHSFCCLRMIRSGPTLSRGTTRPSMKGCRRLACIMSSSKRHTLELT